MNFSRIQVFLFSIGNVYLQPVCIVSNGQNDNVYDCEPILLCRKFTQYLDSIEYGHFL